MPTTEDDQGLYIHLRLELTPTTKECELRKELPSCCKMTQRMAKPKSLDTVDFDALKGEDVEEGYKVLGEASEWVLRMLESHVPDKPVPPQNIGQFLHYIGNQLIIKAVQIPMP